MSKFSTLIHGKLPHNVILIKSRMFGGTCLSLRVDKLSFMISLRENAKQCKPLVWTSVTSHVFSFPIFKFLFNFTDILERKKNHMRRFTHYSLWYSAWKNNMYSTRIDRFEYLWLIKSQTSGSKNVPTEYILIKLNSNSCLLFRGRLGCIRIKFWNGNPNKI